MFRILVTGSRDWEDFDTIHRAITQAHPFPIIIHGNCPTGADAMAQEVADMYGYPWETFPANWSELGKAAGPIRNRAMVNTAPDLCLAFIRNGSKGASGCADMAQKARIRTFIYPQID